MKLTYKGTDERVLPTLGITVKPGDEIDAPEGFSHPDFVAGARQNPQYKHQQSNSLPRQTRKQESD